MTSTSELCQSYPIFNWMGDQIFLKFEIIFKRLSSEAFARVGNNSIPLLYKMIFDNDNDNDNEFYSSHTKYNHFNGSKI